MSLSEYDAENRDHWEDDLFVLWEFVSWCVGVAVLDLLPEKLDVKSSELNDDCV